MDYPTTYCCVVAKTVSYDLNVQGLGLLYNNMAHFEAISIKFVTHQKTKFVSHILI